MKSNTEFHSMYGNGTGHAREYRIAESLLKIVGQVYLELGGDAIDRLNTREIIKTFQQSNPRTTKLPMGVKSF